MEQQPDGSFLLSGAMTFDTVPSLLLEGQKVFLADVVLDLSSVTVVDSAGLALLVEWLRQARNRQNTMQFRNIPEKVLAIARVSDLEDSLPQIM